MQRVRGHMDWDVEQDQYPVVIKLTDENRGVQQKGGESDDELAASATSVAPALAGS